MPLVMIAAMLYEKALVEMPIMAISRNIAMVIRTHDHSFGGGYDKPHDGENRG